MVYFTLERRKKEKKKSIDRQRKFQTRQMIIYLTLLYNKYEKKGSLKVSS